MSLKEITTGAVKGRESLSDLIQSNALMTQKLFERIDELTAETRELKATDERLEATDQKQEARLKELENIHFLINAHEHFEDFKKTLKKLKGSLNWSYINGEGKNLSHEGESLFKDWTEDDAKFVKLSGKERHSDCHKSNSPLIPPLSVESLDRVLEIVNSREARRSSAKGIEFRPLKANPTRIYDTLIRFRAMKPRIQFIHSLMKFLFLL